MTNTNLLCGIVWLTHASNKNPHGTAQPVLKPGESFGYTSTAPFSVCPMLDRTRVVARMSGEYNFVRLAADGKMPLSSTPLKAELG